ncbi:MAG: NusG domain II-containing protein [Firmicutes bacterium]|nr:NusG domain II-containing protein [Bacillota bacterium]
MNKLRHLLTSWDIGLALFFLLAAAALLLGFAAAPEEEGAYIVVTQNGLTIGEYPLSEDADIHIDWQGHSNLLLIREGKAYMAEANCPDGYCLRQGQVHLARQTIVCLPARLVITVGGEEGPDAISR